MYSKSSQLFKNEIMKISIFSPKIAISPSIVELDIYSSTNQDISPKYVFDVSLVASIQDFDGIHIDTIHPRIINQLYSNNILVSLDNIQELPINRMDIHSYDLSLNLHIEIYNLNETMLEKNIALQILMYENEYHLSTQSVFLYIQKQIPEQETIELEPNYREKYMLSPIQIKSLYPSQDDYETAVLTITTEIMNTIQTNNTTGYIDISGIYFPSFNATNDISNTLFTKYSQQIERNISLENFLQSIDRYIYTDVPGYYEIILYYTLENDISNTTQQIIQPFNLYIQTQGEFTILENLQNTTTFDIIWNERQSLKLPSSIFMGSISSVPDYIVQEWLERNYTIYMSIDKPENSDTYIKQIQFDELGEYIYDSSINDIFNIKIQPFTYPFDISLIGIRDLIGEKTLMFRCINKKSSIYINNLETNGDTRFDVVSNVNSPQIKYTIDLSTNYFFTDISFQVTTLDKYGNAITIFENANYNQPVYKVEDNSITIYANGKMEYWIDVFGTDQYSHTYSISILVFVENKTPVVFQTLQKPTSIVNSSIYVFDTSDSLIDIKPLFIQNPIETPVYIYSFSNDFIQKLTQNIGLVFTDYEESSTSQIITFYPDTSYFIETIEISLYLVDLSGNRIKIFENVSYKNYDVSMLEIVNNYFDGNVGSWNEYITNTLEYISIEYTAINSSQLRNTEPFEVRCKNIRIEKIENNPIGEVISEIDISNTIVNDGNNVIEPIVNTFIDTNEKPSILYPLNSTQGFIIDM